MIIHPAAKIKFRPTSLKARPPDWHAQKARRSALFHSATMAGHSALPQRKVANANEPGVRKGRCCQGIRAAFWRPFRVQGVFMTGTQGLGLAASALGLGSVGLLGRNRECNCRRARRSCRSPGSSGRRALRWRRRLPRNRCRPSAVRSRFVRGHTPPSSRASQGVPASQYPLRGRRRRCSKE